MMIRMKSTKSNKKEHFNNNNDFTLAGGKLHGN